MKITDVEAIVLESPLEIRDPQGAEEAAGVRHCLLIKVSTDEGITGWSDVETSAHVGRAAVDAPPSGIAMFDGLRELVRGEDPFDVERLWDKVYRGSIYYGRRGVAIHVLSGFDIACHDIIGKAIGRPIHKILGGAHRDKVRAYASTLFRPTPDAMKQACEFYLSRGFTAIKFGWGAFGRDRKRDIELVAAARRAVGADVELLVDPGWRVNRSACDAIDRIRDLEPYNIYWFEDFLHPECYEGYARVKEAGLRTRLAAGEQESTAWGFHDLIHRGRVDVVQPDLSRCGGLSQIRKILWEAERGGVDVCPHAWLTGLLTAASLHVNACLPRSLFLEYNVSASPMLRAVAGDALEMDDQGMLPVPTRPGLGVDVDERAIEKYRIRA